MSQELPADFPITIEVSSECLGTAQCVMTASELFDLSDQGQSRPRRTVDDATDLDRALRAARSCPTQAITVVTDG